MSPIAIIVLLLQLYIYVVIADVVLSLLINFDVISRSNEIVRQIHTFTYRMTDPAYRRIRQVLPPIAGFDLSPLFVILGVQLLIWLVWKLLGPILG